MTKTEFTKKLLSTHILEDTKIELLDNVITLITKLYHIQENEKIEPKIDNPLLKK